MKAIVLSACLASLRLQAGPVLDSSFPGTDTRVSRNAICAYRGVLYIGGDFSEVGGQPRGGVAAIDIASGRLLSWAPKLLSPTVAVILCKDGVVYLGGGFKSV